jgi:hypothetical protein
MGSDLVYSILSPEWNADQDPRRQGSLLLDCSRTHLFREVDLCRSESMEAGSMERLGSGRRVLITTCTNVGCLAGFVSSSQVTPGCVHADAADM